MNRIQEILAKAEREGSAVRMREIAIAPIGVSPAGSTASARVLVPPIPLPRVEPPRQDQIDREAFEQKAHEQKFREREVPEPEIDEPGFDEREIDDGEIDDEERSGRIRTLPHVALDRRLIAGLSVDRAVVEHYRALRTRIATAEPGVPARALLITSAGEHEGKSLTAANLALSMGSDRQRRVCLVDANLRTPQQHRLFGLPDDAPGLCEVVSGDVPLDEALVTLEEHNLTILPAGGVPSQPGDLLSTTMMRRTCEVLRNHFDGVVVDAPSVLPLADVWILSAFIDRVLLVVRSGVTSKPAIHDAIAALDPAKLLGIVLNDAV